VVSVLSVAQYGEQSVVQSLFPLGLMWEQQVVVVQTSKDALAGWVKPGTVNGTTATMPETRTMLNRRFFTGCSF